MKDSTPLFKLVRLKLLLILGLLSFSSCQKKENPSYIILAVDRLSFSSFSCSEERAFTNSGLNTLCQESIRYTNAYTTSTQSAAAMASFLTGRYPYEHQLHKNQDRIQPDWPLTQEKFKRIGYRTSFFSANASIMKLTGLARGFDHFEDSSFLTQNNYTTPLTEQLKLFQNWVAENSGPHFSVIYNSDLETLNDEGSGLSRFERFDEKLGSFIQFLKQANQWEKNYIIVLGLQGKSDFARFNETPYSNLHSENMNIAFFIKPPRQKGDEGIQQRIDALTSLTDLGLSLMKMAQPDFKEKTTSYFDILDDSALWKGTTKTSVRRSQERRILFEAPNTWSEKLQIKFAVLTGHMLYIDEVKPRVYNRLNDGLETIDLSDSLSDFTEQNRLKLESLRNEYKIQSWSSLSSEYLQLHEKHHRYWFQSNQRSLLFENEKLRIAENKKADPLSVLLVYYLNSKKDKDSNYEIARRVSYNIAFENIWNLWNEKQSWNQPSVRTENQ